METFDIIIVVLFIFFLIWNYFISVNVDRNREAVDGIGEFFQKRDVFFYRPDSTISNTIKTKFRDPFSKIKDNEKKLRRYKKDFKLLTQELGYEIKTKKQKTERVICDTKNSSNGSRHEKCSCSNCQ